MPELLSTDELLALYKIAIKECRFEVRLNWDRTAYYVTLNSGLLAIATGLLKVGGDARVNLVVAGVFFIGLCASVIGIGNIKKGHEYYRHTVVKKTLFEDQLGLTRPLKDDASRPTLAVGTTVGQDEHLQIFHDTEKWLKPVPLTQHHGRDCRNLDRVLHNQRTRSYAVSLALLPSSCNPAASASYQIGPRGYRRAGNTHFSPTSRQRPGDTLLNRTCNPLKTELDTILDAERIKGEYYSDVARELHAEA